MQLVPARKPRSAWRALILFFAALLTFGVLAPVVASAHGHAALRVHDSTVVEPHHGYTFAHVKITLNHRVNHKVSVGFATKDLPPWSHLKAAKAWKDYKPTAGRAYIPKWHRTAIVHVKVYADRKVEGNEFFAVKLFHPHGAVIADRFGLVRIIDHYRPPLLPKLAVHKAVVKEGGAAWFKVSLSAPARMPVIFDYATKDGSLVLGPLHPAVAGQDYDKTYDHGTILPGKTCTFVKVMTRYDSNTTEGPEYFLLKVFDVHGADVVDGHTLGIILDGPAPATP